MDELTERQQQIKLWSETTSALRELIPDRCDGCTPLALRSLSLASHVYSGELTLDRASQIITDDTEKCGGTRIDETVYDGSPLCDLEEKARIDGGCVVRSVFRDVIFDK